MDITNLKQRLLNYYRTSRGWMTNRKIVVFESDDWGSIRMPSRDVFDKMLKSGIKVDQCPYNRFDSLESEEDMDALFQVLRRYKDKNGRHPIFTLNFVLANPDFDKIKNSFFNEYHYELFTETYKRYYGDRNAFLSIRQGIDDSLIYPQFHGREHLNINRWLSALRNGMPESRLAFDNRMFGISTNITSEKRRSYLASLAFDSKDEIQDHKVILEDGLNIFEKTFNYRSESFIPTNYTWPPAIEEFLAFNGIKYIQGSFFQVIPVGNNERSVINSRKLGSVNTCSQINLTRNAYFEPSLSQINYNLSNCIKNITAAFLLHKPAIICSHRLNYIGRLVQSNRNTNLQSLKRLIETILLKWKNVEFMNSVELGELIKLDIQKN